MPTTRSLGDVNGMSLPAVLNEVISVTGVISFPYDQNATSTPVDQVNGVIPNPLGPILLFGNSLTIGGTATASTTGGGGGGAGGAGGGGAGGAAATGFNANAQLLTAGNSILYANRILGSVNRSNTTDFAAPADNVPTFRRTFTVPTGTTTTTAGSPTDHLTFTQVGTSMSAAIVTGAYALVSSALNYWITLARSNGYTADAYLNTPVGTDSLNFGKHCLQESVGLEQPQRHQRHPGLDGGSGDRRQRRRQSLHAADALRRAVVSLVREHQRGERRRGGRGLRGDQLSLRPPRLAVTSTRITTDWSPRASCKPSTDNSTAMGLPQAGAMAALLGGTATYSAVEPGLNNEVFNENPDDPAAEQRRFNFFDYAADGQFNGSITMNELKMLSRILLPSPDAYAITDRQRASANGFLLDPDRSAQLRRPAAHPADVRVGAEVGCEEVPEHLADEIWCRQGGAARVHVPVVHAV